MSDNEIKNDSIKNVMNFYMIANSLKYTFDDDKESKASKASHIYGAITLATAINSEYKIVDNLGELIRTIILSQMYEQDKDKLDNYLSKTNNDKNERLEMKYRCEIYNYFWDSSLVGHFAHECIVLENRLSSFFNKYLDEKQINTNNIGVLYYLAKNHGVFDGIGNNKANANIFKFYYLNRVLKEKVRSGWDNNHWNINNDRIETIAEHVVGTIALAISLDKEFDLNINLDKVITTLSNHEIGEIEIGDITPFDGITKEQKQNVEHKAMKNIVKELCDKEEILNNLFEFDEEKTEDAKFAHYCDKLEADIQSKVYQDMGCHNALDNQENNIVFKSSKVEKMLENGAKTAFDIWYEYDKGIYKDSPVFTKVLTYVKNNKINMLV